MKTVLRIFMVIAVAAALYSCSGYLSHNGTNSGKTTRQAEKLNLAMEGGGYLSSDTANDITPFMFRNGSTYIFFASDRDGALAIYYAQMDSAGLFYNLNKLGTDINQAGTVNFSPVLFQYGGNTYISYISETAGATNIFTYPVNSAFHVSGSVISIPSADAVDINVITPASGAPYLLVVQKSNPSTILNYSWNAGYWMQTGSIAVSSPHNSVAGYQVSSGPFTSLYMLYDSTAGSKRQLSGEVWITEASLTGLAPYPISAYSSSFNDAYPFIDAADHYKVYFSSDRYGKGYYNLYRYNTTTYDAQIPSLWKGGPNTVFVAPLGTANPGSDSHSGFVPSSPLLTIQNAVNDAVSWGMHNIFLQSGVYSTNIGLSTSAMASSTPGVYFNNVQNIALTGGFDNNFTAANGMSVLDGGYYYNQSSQYYVLDILSSANLTFNNLVIRNATNGQGVYLSGVVNSVFSNLVISNNGFYSLQYTIPIEGGGIYATGSWNNVFNNCLITFNNALWYGGGVYLDQNSTSNYFNNCSIMYNLIYYSPGGGVYCYSTNSTSLLDLRNYFPGTTIINNSNSGGPDDASTNNNSGG